MVICLTVHKVGTTPAVLGYSAGAAIIMGVFNFTGGRFTGFEKDPELDEFERKQQMRKNRRRPIEETIAELGEGRGKMGLYSYLSTINLSK